MITGSTGYLGRALVDLLVRPPRGAGAGGGARPARATKVPPSGVEIAAADLADVEALERAARDCSGVLHLAASVGNSAEGTRRVNVGGTRNVPGSGSHDRQPVGLYGPSPLGPFSYNGLFLAAARGTDEGSKLTAEWIGRT